ncbi:MAG: radical SAM protein [Promethearchaeota archaeon]
MRGSSALYFCGGEPTLRKDLPELLDHATRRNMFNMINTNGSLVGDLLLKPGYEKFLAQMDVVILSLDSLSVRQLADMYRVGEPAARKVLRNLLALKVLQNYVPFKLVANTVITRDNVGESHDILDFCNDLGITFSPVSANKGHEPDWELVRSPGYRELVAAILSRARGGYPMIASPGMLERLLLVKGFRCFPTVFDHVDHDGGAFWPCKAYPGAVKVPVLAHRSVRGVHAAGSELVDPYNFHGHGPNQCGGDCAWMQNCVTDAYGRALTRGIFGSGILGEILGLI